MIDILHAHLVPAAYAVLPPAMSSPQATALLLAIGLQESQFLHRRQLAGGPARGFWSFEVGGVRGVLEHPRTADPIAIAVRRLRYADTLTAPGLHLILEHADVLAACFARCLLWTSPGRLPEPTDADAGWAIYQACWRPGKPRRATWDANYRGAWDRVLATWEPPRA